MYRYFGMFLSVVLLLVIFSVGAVANVSVVNEEVRFVTGMEVEVSSVHHRTKLGTNAIDGDLTTPVNRWISAKGDVEPWIAFMLPSAVAVDTVVVYSGVNTDPEIVDHYIVDSFIVEAFLGSEWVEVANVEGNSDYRCVVSFMPTSANAWRLRFTIPNTYEDVGERQVRAFQIRLLKATQEPTTPENQLTAQAPATVLPQADGSTADRAQVSSALQDLQAARAHDNVVLQADFATDDLSNWVLEGDGSMEIVDGAMVVKSLNGSTTIWHKQQLYSDLLIEYEAHIDPPKSAANLNTFFHATDPSGQPIYEGKRSGVYAEYHTLPLYIYTFTGDQGSAKAPGYSRFRKDPGFVILSENADFKAETDQTYQVSILIEGERLRYYLNDALVHDYTDPQPYRSGWFAFRTWSTNLTINSLVVKQLGSARP